MDEHAVGPKKGNIVGAVGRSSGWTDRWAHSRKEHMKDIMCSIACNLRMTYL